MKLHNELTFPDGAHTYSRGSRFLALAAEGYGLDVSDRQSDDWAAMFGGIYKLDGIVDSQLPERERKVRFNQLIDDVTLAIHDGRETMACEVVDGCQLCHLRQNLVGRGEFDLVGIGFRLERLFDIAEKRRTTTKVPNLTRQCADEGRTTASLLQIPLQTGKERETMRFNFLISNLGAAGTLLDTALDLEQDYDEGLCKVAPSKLNVARILCRSLPLFAYTAAHMPKTLREEVQNSIKEALAEAKTQPGVVNNI